VKDIRELKKTINQLLIFFQLSQNHEKYEVIEQQQTLCKTLENKVCCNGFRR
jgi:hypothetical protein